MKKNNEWRLREEVLFYSLKSNFHEALKEWHHVSSYYTDDHTCVCGKKHIKEVNVVENRLTGFQLEVGSECINHFFDTEVGSIFSSLKRIKMDSTKSISKEALMHAYRFQYIDRHETEFYRRIMRKRFTSLNRYDKQRKFDINQMLVRKWEKTNGNAIHKI